MVKFIPNLISSLRIMLSFFLFIIILERKFLLAVIILLIGSISDFLDGYIARKYDASSAFGAMLDPMCDKVLIITSYTLLAYINLIPVFVAAIVIGRDLIIISTILMCKFFDITLHMRPIMSSKINTTIQLCFAMLVIACSYLSANMPYIIDVCAIIACVSTIFSGVDYAKKYYWIKDKILRR